MAAVRMQASWIVEFNQQEFAVLLRVLGDRANGDDWKAADKLCDRLTQMRVDYTRNLLKQMDNLERHLHEKLDAEQSDVTE